MQYIELPASSRAQEWCLRQEHSEACLGEDLPDDFFVLSVHHPAQDQDVALLVHCTALLHVGVQDRQDQLQPNGLSWQYVCMACRCLIVSDMQKLVRCRCMELEHTSLSCGITNSQQAATW